MKQKLKKIGMLAVLLASAIIFALQKVEGQKTIGGNKECTSMKIDCPGWFTVDRYVCVRGGGGVVCNCGDMSPCR